jgi:hypothetical protein
MIEKGIQEEKPDHGTRPFPHFASDLSLGKLCFDEKG